ncbi:MAG: MFS transporter [Clostridiales bacterium]|nr:MFS transporter [Clostridiales bacterium]
MARNKKYLANAILLCVLGVVLMFLYSGLQSDHINIITAFSSWSSNAIQYPLTVGNFICIPLTFVYGSLFMKYGVKKPLIVVMIITAIGVLGIVASNGLAINDGAGNYALFFISEVIVRCGCMINQLAGFMLVANWFIRYRGQAMGIVTIGSPLFSIIGTSVMTNFITTHLGNDYRPFYVGIAVIIVVVCIVVAVGVKDTPEDAGLYPDGADHPPVSESGENDEVQLTVKEVLKMKKSWMLITSFGAFQFIISACMGSMAVYFMWLSGTMDASVYWVPATKFLAMGAALGIPMSYVFGFLDDKFGSVVASIVLGLCEFMPVLALMFQTGDNRALLLLWGFGVACMTGGVPTLHPCITSFAFGRREYQSANRIIMTIQLIPYSFASLMMSTLITMGKAKTAYGILVVIIIVGIVALFPMLKMKDANAADRMYGEK